MPEPFDPAKFSSPQACQLREKAARDLMLTAQKMGIAPPSDYEVELTAFRRISHGLKMGHLQAEFCANLFRMQWGASFLLEACGLENTYATHFLKRLCQYRVVDAMGTACISGETRIDDPMTGERPTVRELFEAGIAPSVMTLLGVQRASVPFVKGRARLYEVVLSDGSRFLCTRHHRLLSSTGYRELGDISAGDEILGFVSCHPQSSGGVCPSIQTPDGPDFQKRVEDFQGSYSSDSRPCDEQLLSETEIYQSSFPSRGDAPKRRDATFLQMDEMGYKSAGIHPWSGEYPLSSSPLFLHTELSGMVSSSHCAAGTPLSSDVLSQFGDRFHSDKSLVLQVGKPIPDSLHSGLACNSFYREQIEQSYGIRVSQKRVVSIRYSHEDVFFDLTVPEAGHYFAEGAIHHNSGGKSTLAAAYCYTKWKSSPFDTSVFISTTTGDAGQSRAWGIIKDFHNNDLYKIGGRIEYLSLITLNADAGTEHRDYRDSIKAVLIPKGAEGDNAVAAIVGRHNKNVLWTCDEMPFMPSGILMGRRNVMANLFWQFIGIGNMPKEGDPLYLDAEPKNGWESVNPDECDGWETKSGYCVYMDGEKSPNMQVDRGVKPPFPGLMSWEMLDAISNDSGGPDSPGYWNQVRGFPASGSKSDTVLTRELIINNKADREPIWSGQRRQILAGLDLGFRIDGDPCVLAFGGLGTDDEGRTILGLEAETIRLVVKVGVGETFENQIAKLVVDHCSRRGCHDLELDVSGEGGIFSQAIAEEAKRKNYQLTIYPTSFMGLPDENERFHHGGQLRPAREIFDKKVTQLWMSFRKSVMNGVIRNLKPDSRAGQQFRMRKQSFDEKKKMSVESKKIMKKRLKRSPDDADSVALLGNLALKKGLPREPQSARALAVQGYAPPEEKPPTKPYSSHAAHSQYAGR